jgi:transposase-like protein/transposase Tn5 family protein
MSACWAEQELASVRLGDRRLDRRLSHLVRDLAARPEASVPQATGTWAGAKAAYRFWDNPRVDPSRIRAGHRDRLVQRLPSDDVVLALQDTTSFDFTTHPRTRGLGYLNHPKRFGFLAHTVFCVSGQGVPLGVLHQQVWRRDPKHLGKRRQRRHKATAAKESRRWLRGLAATQRLLPATTRVVLVADREADFYDLLAAPRRPGVELLIRAKQRRRVRHEARLLLPAVQAAAPLGTHTVEVQGRGGRPARQATLTLRVAQVALEPPSTHPRRRQLAAMPVTVVLAAEEAPPSGEKPLRWLLLTTRPVRSLEEAITVVTWYSRRWLIERYHFVLKSGCRLEALQLEEAARLQRALATYSIVAWRLLWLTYEARRRPDAPCTEVLTEEEWQVLHRQRQPRQALPERPPRLGEAVRWIAQLGGFLARTHDGEPGVKTLWRGLRRLQDLVTGSRLTVHQPPPIVVGNG